MPLVAVYDKPEFKRFAAVISFVAACIGILQGVKALMGNDPPEALPYNSPSPTPTGFVSPCCTPILPTVPTLPILPTPTLPSLPNTPTPEPPDFIVISENFVSQCMNGSCTMRATFRNIGGDGSAIAIFHIISNRGGGQLALCSAVIPNTNAQGSAGTGCSASSGALVRYFSTGGTVHMRVTVNNPD